VNAQTEHLPYASNMIDLDPNVRDMFGLPAPRLTYDWRAPNELKRIKFMQDKLMEIGKAMGAKNTWLGALSPGSPGAHHQGGARMGKDPGESVVNSYGQTWDIPNLFVVGSANHPTMSGFNPTLTIEALAYRTAEAIAMKYRKSPGPLA
jgi:gluconate 2-dehydrogenase alpha chain